MEKYDNAFFSQLQFFIQVAVLSMQKPLAKK